MTGVGWIKSLDGFDWTPVVSIQTQKAKIEQEKPMPIERSKKFSEDSTSDEAMQSQHVDYSHAAVDQAIAEMQAEGRAVDAIAHTLICSGLCHMRGNMCDAHVVEELEFVRGWIVKRIAEVRAGMN